MLGPLSHLSCGHSLLFESAVVVQSWKTKVMRVCTELNDKKKKNSTVVCDSGGGDNKLTEDGS